MNHFQQTIIKSLSSYTETIHTVVDISFQFLFVDRRRIDLKSDFRVGSSCVTVATQLFDNGYNEMCGEKAWRSSAKVKSVECLRFIVFLLLADLFEQNLYVLIRRHDFALLIGSKITISAAL
ncbi:hypothetical protein D3C72_1495970 [compost metagenome]